MKNERALVLVVCVLVSSTLASCGKGGNSCPSCPTQSNSNQSSSEIPRPFDGKWAVMSVSAVIEGSLTADQSAYELRSLGGFTVVSSALYIEISKTQSTFTAFATNDVDNSYTLTI